MYGRIHQVLGRMGKQEVRQHTPVVGVQQGNRLFAIETDNVVDKSVLLFGVRQIGVVVGEFQQEVVDGLLNFVAFRQGGARQDDAVDLVFRPISVNERV